MATGVRTKYSVGINGRGFIINGSPDSPGYSRAVVPIQIDRLAISDLAYSDFSGSGLFYVAQTDWSAGIKNQTTWADDAKFYYSTNIDAYSEQGCIKLEPETYLYNTFNENVNCGGSFVVNSASDEYVGTHANGSGYAQIYTASGPWTAIAATTFGTSHTDVAQLISHKNKLYSANVGTNNTYSLGRFDGTTWTDKTAAAITAITAAGGGTNFAAARCMTTLGSTLYVAGDTNSSTTAFIVATVDEGANFTCPVVLKTAGYIVSMVNFGGQIYYLLVDGSVAYLRVYDPVGNTDTDVTGGVFYGCTLGSLNTGNEDLLRVFAGNLIITIPPDKVYQLVVSASITRGSDLSLIYRRDLNKDAIGREASIDLTEGAKERQGRLFWGNLIYDGEDFFNFKKQLGDSTSYYLRPLYTTATEALRYVDSNSPKNLTYNDPFGYYKPTLAKNFLIFSEMAQIVKIDKLLYSVTILFQPLATNEQIQVSYSIDGRTNWTTLDTLTKITEGSTATKKEIFIPTTVIYNKIFWRINLGLANATTATTPKVFDFIVAYKPIPDYKNQWTIRLEMCNRVKLLNNQYEERDSADLMAELWTEKLTKQKVPFEDVDYRECSLVSAMTSAATSALVDKTRLFPRRGRMRIVSGGVSEEISYTSAEISKLKGITRALRSTKARGYSAGQLIKNDFDVYISSISNQLNFTDEQKTEGTETVTLIEA